MMSYEKCVPISRENLNQLLREVKKDGFIIRNKNGIYGRFIKNDKRYSNTTDAFSTPLIGYLRGSDAYIKSALLTHYSQNKAN